MASTDARPIPQKNVAYRITFPIFDADGDLVTGATGLDSEVSKDGGTFADCTNEATEIATSSGMYYLDLTSTEMNADTVAVIVKTSSSGAKTTPIVMYPEEAGDIRVNVTQFGSTNGTFSGGRPEVNTTHAAGTAWGSGAITAASIATDAITNAKIATDAIGASELAADAVAEIADAVWDEDATAHQTQGTFGQAIGDPVADADTIWGLVNTNLNATISSRASQTSLDTLDDYVDTEVAAIKAKTDQLTFTTANRVDSTVVDKTGFSLSAAGIQAIWDALTTALTTVGSIGKLLVDNINATISSRASQTSLDTLDDYVDSEVAAIKAKTDQFTFTVANQVDSNALSGGGGLDAAGVRAAVGLASANLDTQLTAIDDFLDTEISAIKAKTDNLPADPADASDIASSFATVNTKLDTIDDFIDTEVSAVKAVTDKLDTALELDGVVYRYTTNALEQAPTGGSAPTAAQIADAVWDEDTTGHTTAGTFGEQLKTDVDAILVDTGTTLDGKIDVIDDFLDTEVAAIKAKTDNLPADPADASDIASSFSTVNTKLDTIDDYIDTELAAVKTVVDGIQTDLDNATDGLGALKTAITAVDDFVDTEVTAIKTVTDKLDSALELDGAVYRYTTNALEQAPTSGGAGLTAEQTAQAVWNATVDTYQADRSFGSKIGLHLPVVSPDIDYKRISKVVKEEVSQIPTPDIKPTDLAPIIKELEKVMAEVKSIKFPEIPKTDLQPLVKQLEELQQEVNSIEIPKTDLSAINEDLELLSINVHRIIEDVGDVKKGQLGRIREFFEADIDEIKTKISEVREDFRKYPRLKLTDRKNDS